MKKRMICVMVCLMAAICLLFCACGGGKDSKEGSTQPSAETSGHTFVYKDTKMVMKAEAAPVLATLGDAKSYTEAASCAFDGLDKTYYYGSFYLYTYPDGDIDRINMVVLCDDTVATAEGISIGDSKDKVESIYGADSYNGVNAYVLNSGETSLTIIMENDQVSSIQYAAVFD
ncbi:MAG: hypothetical protein IKZ95_04475 [Lachnospiraceae bacterium]|nr:hypothetical protein [Lachnospiraceae bacterium]